MLCACTASSQPVIAGPKSWQVTVGQQFTASYKTTNTDGSAVTLSVTGVVGAVFDVTTGVIVWTPHTTDAVPSVRYDRRCTSFNVCVYVKLYFVAVAAKCCHLHAGPEKNK